MCRRFCTRLPTSHTTNYDQMNYFTWGYAYLAGCGQPLRGTSGIRTQTSFGTACRRQLVCGGPVSRLSDLAGDRASGLLAVRTLVSAGERDAGAGRCGLGDRLSVAESRYNLALGLVLLGVVSRQRAWRLRDGLYLAAYAGYALPYEGASGALRRRRFGRAVAPRFLCVRPSVSRGGSCGCGQRAARRRWRSLSQSGRSTWPARAAQRADRVSLHTAGMGVLRLAG